MKRFALVTFALLALSLVTVGRAPRRGAGDSLPPEIRALLRQIREGDDKEKLEAIESLDRIEGALPFAVDALIEAMNGSEAVAAAADTRLSRAGEPALTPLIRELDSPIPARRIRAGSALTSLDVQQRGDRTPGWWALYTRRYVEEIRRPLIFGRIDPDEGWRKCAFDVLLYHSDEAILPELFREAEDAEAPAETRVKALGRLGSFGHRRGEPHPLAGEVAGFLLKVIEGSGEPSGEDDEGESKSPIRDAALSALGRLGDARVPAVRRLLLSTNDRIVSAAMPSRFDVPLDLASDLARMLNHRSRDVRLKAADCFHDVRAPSAEARFALRKALGDEDFWVRVFAATALQRNVCPGDGRLVLVAADLLGRARDDVEWHLVLGLVQSMKKRAAAAAPALVRLLGTTSRRADALVTLEIILPAEEFDRRFLPQVRASLKDATSPASPLQLVRAMGPRARTLAPLLVPYLSAESDLVRYLALDALAATGSDDPNCAEAARKLLESADADVRAKARAVLQAMTEAGR